MAFFVYRPPILCGWLGCLGLLLAACAGGRGEDPQEFQMLFDKGRAYLERGNPRMALPALQQANRLRPGNAELLTRLGLAYDQSGLPLQAMESLEEAQRLRPEDVQVNNNLGVARLRVHAASCGDLQEKSCQRLLDQAEEALQTAIRVASASSTAPAVPLEGLWFNLALLYKQRGQEAPMVAALESSLAVSSHHLPARLELADHYRSQARTDLERQQLRSALAAFPDHVVLLERLVDSFLGGRSPPAAGSVATLAPGERTEVRALLSRILALAPGTEAAHRASQRILLLDNR
ncbi:MAG: hypothetical protein H7837_00760 [Magnetococcus sp. MYC-9]